MKLSNILKNSGVEVIDVSSGGMVPHVVIPVEPNYQVSFANQIKNTSGVITGTVGLITDAIQAEEILENNYADFIILGRELLRNPYFPLNAANVLNKEIHYPAQYERA